MEIFQIHDEQSFDPIKHVEKILGANSGGDYTVACWEPHQVSPYHCHPEATEIYFCFEGGRQMKTPEARVKIEIGGVVVHPPGELHEYSNGPKRSLLIRVRYGANMFARVKEWPTNPSWVPDKEDLEYFIGE